MDVRIRVVVEKHMKGPPASSGSFIMSSLATLASPASPFVLVCVFFFESEAPPPPSLVTGGGIPANASANMHMQRESLKEKDDKTRMLSCCCHRSHHHRFRWTRRSANRSQLWQHHQPRSEHVDSCCEVHLEVTLSCL